MCSRALDGKAVKLAVAGLYDSFLRDLELLARIDSGTGHKEGSARIAGILKERMEDMGGTVEFRENDRAVHVIARFRGEGELRVLVSPHTDTVWPDGEAARRPFRIDANRRAYGAGAGDCKASVAQTIYLVKAIKELGLSSFGEIVLYFDAEEEKGSDTEAAILQELAGQVDVALINDTARPDWGIVTRRKGSAKYDLQVTGIAGHGGSGPHVSASATMELGHQIHGLYQLASPQPEGAPFAHRADALREKGIADHGQFIPENTINVGVIGTANQSRGAIPDNAFAQVQVRCFDRAELLRLDGEIRALAQAPIVPGTRVLVEGGITSVPVEQTPEAAKLVELYKAIVKREYDAEVTEWSGGGGTVANDIFQAVPTLDSIGVEVDPALNHTRDEYADLDTFIPRTVAMILLIDALAHGELPGEERTGCSSVGGRMKQCSRGRRA